MLASGFPAVGWAATGVGDGIVLEEQSSAPETPEASKVHVYVDTTATPVLKMKDDAGTVTTLSSTTALSLDGAYNNGSKIDVDGDVLEIEVDDASNNGALHIDHNEATNDNTAVLIENAADAANAITIDIDAQTTGRDIEGTGASWYVTGAGGLTADSLTSTANTTVGGDLAVTGTTTLTGAMYQASIAAAAAGNENLTVNAAGNGTINIGGVSTGAITLSQNTTASGTLTVNGNADIGNAATDTLTITSIIDGSVTLDDGSTDSPSLILKDATDETATLLKADAGNVTMTPGAATESFQVLTGNLKVGNGTEGVTLNGNDAYVTGTFEVDGATQLDGAATFNSTTAFTGATNTFTEGAGEYVRIDAATAAHTDTAGALDINVIAGATAVSGVLLDFEVENTFANGYGLYINADDDATGGEETFDAVYIANDEGTASVVNGVTIANTVDTGLKVTAGAASQAIVIDAAATDNTGTEGVIDIGYDTKAAAAAGMNLKVTHVAGGSGQAVAGIEVEVDSDADNASDTTYGVLVNASDTTDTGTVGGIHILGAGLDIGLQVDTGGIRSGTGSAADQTLGADTIYAEGLVEIDGVLYPDGGITGDGAANVVGMTSLVEAYTGAGNTITNTECGSVYTNAGDADGSLHTLPEASTAIGCEFTFVVTAAQALVVELDNADVFLHLTLDAGDQIQSSTVGDTITVMAVDAVNYAVISVYPTAADWADGGA
jgi:hypothetical protein